MQEDFSVTIRPMTAADRQLAEDFFAQMGGESRAFFNRNDGNYRGLMNCFETLNPARRDFAAVIPTPEGGERMIGLVFLWALDTMTPWLGIAVAEDFKGKHLGRKLMAYAENYCHALGKGGIFLTTAVANIRGQGLYTRSGYTRLGMYHDGEILFFRNFPDTPLEEDGTL